MAVALTLDLSILRPSTFGVDVIGNEVIGGQSAPGGIVNATGWAFGGLVQASFTFNLDTNARQRYANQLGMRLAGAGRAIMVPLWTDRMQPDTITATLDGAHAAEATTVGISVTAGTLGGGEWFGIDHDTAGARVYGIAEIVSETDAGGGQTDYTVIIDPPLRDAAAGGATLTFARPSCLMRLPAGQSAAWGIDATRLSRPSVTFIEAQF